MKKKWIVGSVLALAGVLIVALAGVAFSLGHTLRDERGQGLAAQRRVAVPELPQPRVALCAFDEGGNARRERRVDYYFGYMAQQAVQALAGVQAFYGRDGVLVGNLEGVPDQADLVRPVPVDGGLGHAGPGGHGLDGKGAVTSLAELAERRVQDYLP